LETPEVRLVRRILSCCLLACCAWVPACSVLPGSATHPLVGRIWDAQAHRYVTRDELLQRAASSRVVLLGEVHDNPEHHRIQGELLQALLRGGARPALGMEQFDVERQADLDRAAAAADATPDTLAAAGRLDMRGWEWPFYRPLVASALDAHLPIVALNLSRSGARKVMAEGFPALGPGRAAELALDTTWTAARQQGMEQEIVEGHCGEAPADLLPKLVLAQRARDATMADALLAHSEHGAIAILGNGHAWVDRGVPVYLAQRVPSATVLALGLLEVDPERGTPDEYAASPSGTRRFDFVWFTEPAQREDPCQVFTERRK
jgi:uncharacterized iron-regulated protein